MKPKILRAIRVANLPREICNHLHGEHHPLSHRMWVGLVVMMSGVSVAHMAGGLPHLLALVVDMLGYGIHALGAVPYLEWLLEE